MNAWFPKFRFDGTIASGNDGIWLTPPVGQAYRYSAVGIGPIWAGLTIVFNRNDNTTQVGSIVIAKAYNDYRGSVSGNWAGVLPTGLVQRYNGPSAVFDPITSATGPRFGGPSFGYLSPYQTNPDNLRALIIEGSVVAIDVILDWAWERNGAFYVYQIATGVHTRAIKDAAGQVVSIRDDEAPIVAFLAPDDSRWLLCGTQTGTLVRPVYDYRGYWIPGDLYFPDALLVGDRLRVAGSTAQGAPRFDEWIDFTAQRVDLRKP